MGNCTNCASKGSCSTRKGEERELLAQLLPELFPARRWGEINDAARDGISEREGRRLAQQASVLLKAPTFFQPGEPDEGCDYIYVLCVGRQPCLHELWDAEALDFQEGEVVRDKMLRVALSSLARVCTVQEVVYELTREGGDDGAGHQLTRQALPGVYDPVLLRRTQALVELLVAAEITFLDFGLIERPPVSFAAPSYEADFGQPPGIVNYLFYPQPTRALATTYIPAAH